VKGALALLVVALGCVRAGPGHAESAALVLDAESRAIHYAYRMDAPHPPASLTKMMTIYMAFEALRDGHLKRGQRLKVSRAAARQRPSRLGLRRGKTIGIEDAILALVTKSANDVSVVIAEAIAGSESAFAGRMTERAHTLGMTGTVFRNASGLHHPEQTTTARDMAQLAIALIRDFPDQYRLFSTKSFVWRGRRHRNHNPMLSSYDGADGVKTGYIRQSGFNLVASARRDGRRLIGVVLGGKSIQRREWMMATMLDYGFLRLGDRDAQTKFPALPYTADWPGETAFDIALRGAPELTQSRPKDLSSSVAVPAKKAARSRGARKWSIQVGAYRSAPPANEAALLAADRIPALLGNARVLVTQVVHGGQPMFRARLTGLSEGEARTSCRQLALYSIPCLAVGDTGEFRTSSLVR
jgi:D-alanyl-D-alanine carboxypeptidase